MISCERLRDVRDGSSGGSKQTNVLQMPVLRPTEKQLASLLNETDRTTVDGAVSIGGRVFIVGEGR